MCASVKPTDKHKQDPSASCTEELQNNKGKFEVSKTSEVMLEPSFKSLYRVQVRGALLIMLCIIQTVVF